MFCKVLGAVMVIASCGGFGFKLAAAHIREEKILRQLTGILDFMECELQFRHTPLPELCRRASTEASGCLSAFFLSLTRELEDRLSPDVAGCIQAALKKHPDIPSLSAGALELFGRSLGRFDLQGQLKGLEAVRQECRRNLEHLNRNKQERLRGYQTLGLCAGAALAILLL